VLRPIGESLKIISSGGLFILDFAAESNDFFLNFSLDAADDLNFFAIICAVHLSSYSWWAT
jgi:hypothetical protein